MDHTEVLCWSTLLAVEGQLMLSRLASALVNGAPWCLRHEARRRTCVSALFAWEVLGV